MHVAFLLLLSFFFVQGDEGIGIDPFGRPVAAYGDGGPIMDPNGGRSGLADDGAGLDPHGGRRFAVRGDHRCTIDPNGGCVSAFAGARIDDNG